MKRTNLLLLLSLLVFSYACNSENKTESENVEETKVEEIVNQVPETTEKKVTSSVTDFADWSYEKIEEAVTQTNATMVDTKNNLKLIEEQIATSTGAAKTEAEAKYKVYLNRVQILEEKLANLDLAKKDKEPKGK
jgi:hypothetical protein